MDWKPCNLLSAVRMVLPCGEDRKWEAILLGELMDIQRGLVSMHCFERQSGLCDLARVNSQDWRDR